MNEERGQGEQDKLLTLPRPCLMLVTEAMEQSRLLTTVQAAVAGGVDIVQVRDKSQTPQQLLKTATTLKSSLPDTLMVINGYQEGTCIGAIDGIHLPEWSLPEWSSDLAQVRQAVGPHRLIGRSVHSVASAVAAQEQGADYLVAGTIFASASHPDVIPAGLEFLRHLCREVTLPVIAIGGITPERVQDCLQAGASGVAVLSPIMRADDPYSVARQYQLALT